MNEVAVVVTVISGYNGKDNAKYAIQRAVEQVLPQPQVGTEEYVVVVKVLPKTY